jgi:hypothetical protein
LPICTGSVGTPTPAERAALTWASPVMSVLRPVAPLGWLVFVELPVDEANAPLRQALARSSGLLLVGLALAFLAGLFPGAPHGDPNPDDPRWRRPHRQR